jgi:hypothetical protein
MALSAVSCLQRGVTNLRANWELVFVAWLQSFVTATLVLAGFAPPLAVLGLASFDVLSSPEVEWAEVLGQAGQLMNRGSEAWILLAASLLVSSAIWLMAFLVYCFFQGGILGVLMTGDRQAPEGRPRGWQWFRTFSRRDLRGWGGRNLWRYFWLLNLISAISLLWLLMALVVFGLTALGGEQWGVTAALGIGCGAAIPLVFGFVMIILWSSLAQADLALGDSAVGKSLRRSLNLLGRRLGAVVVLSLIALLVGIVIGIGIWILSVVSALFLPETGSGRWVGAVVQFGLSAIQMITGSVVAVGFSASIVSLVRSERTQEYSA